MTRLLRNTAPIAASVRSTSDTEELYEAHSFLRVPFLRQTFRWDQQAQRYVEHREAPDEGWMVWSDITPDEKPEAWIRYQRRFDGLGIKITDQLVIDAASPILNFLKESFLLRIGDVYEENSLYGRPVYGIIDERLFRDLFFRFNEIKDMIRNAPSDQVRRVLTILTEFLNYTFSAARESYRDARRTGQILFHHAWTLFRPGDIVYEKLPVAPFQDLYEQCFSVHSSEDSVSRYDGTRVLCLTLAEMTYRSGQVNTSGPVTVWTTRYIREYDGVKQLTTEDLGIVPLSMLAPEKRHAIKTALMERGRRFLEISQLPFSFWNYKGPYTIVHPLTGHGTIEEARLSLERRRQRVSLSMHP